MARDIVLKDGKGNPVTYERVNQIRVAGFDVNGDPETQKFIHMSGLYCYAYIPLGDAIKVTKKMPSLGGNDVWFTGVNESELQEIGHQLDDGTWGVSICILQKDDLVVGNTYTTEELIRW